jgi:hypothetical protein
MIDMVEASTCRESLRTPTDVAQQILTNLSITLATAHSSGVFDNANAWDNIVHTAARRAAHRSSYSEGGKTGPGGTVALAESMLTGMQTLGSEFAFTVSEIAGGVHSETSRHHAGVAFVVSVIIGVEVSSTNADVASYRARAAQLGAIEILGPGDQGYAKHVHLAWPQP